MARFKLFGFSIGKATTDEVLPSFAPPVMDDGAMTVTAAANYGLSIDLDTNYKNEIELITRYRELALQPEIESAIDDIMNEAVITDDENPSPVQINLINLKVSSKIKTAIEEEFDNILTLLNFKSIGADIFRRYYIDGRLNYHIIVNKDEQKRGIQELRYIDPRKLTKVRELKKEKDPETGLSIVQNYTEYFVYSDQLYTKTNTSQSGVKIAADSIISVTSGLMDAKRATVLSFIHKCIKPLNMLRQIEDASVIYKISRAPERRIFYVDVGNLPKLKAEQYLRDLMTKYKNKVVFNAATGEVVDDRKYLSMQEDFWMPRRDGKSTEITTLPSSAAFDDMSMVEYFEKKLYKALNVPYSRLHQGDSSFSIGRSQEISRDEIKFAKFISRIRHKFSEVFDQALRVQLVFKGICTADEFEEYKQQFIYDWLKDNNYSELKDAELIGNRVALLTQVDPYVGKYYSLNWIRHKILNMSEDEIKDIDKDIESEVKGQLYPDPKLPIQDANAQEGLQLQQTLQQEQPPEPTEPSEAPEQKQPKTKEKDKTNRNPYYNG